MKKQNQFFRSNLPVVAFLLAVMGLGGGFLLSGRVHVSSAQSSFASGTSPEFIYSEQQGSVVVFWSAPVVQLSSRQEIARVADEARYGVRASLAPMKDKLAYLVNSPQIRDVYGSSQLWLLDLGNSQKQLIGEGFDINAVPSWSPDGGSVLVRRSLPVSDELVRTEIVVINLASPEKKEVLVSDEVSAGLYIVGWSADGTKAYYTAIGPTGTDLYEIGVLNGARRAVAHLSDKVARDYQLSPDHSSMAFTTADQQGSKVNYAVRIVGIAAGDRKTLHEGPSEELAPAWLPDSETLSVSVLNQANGNGVSNVGTGDYSAMQSVTQSSRDSFDAPVSWSPDAQFLVVRSFKGSSLQNVSNYELTLISPGGGRQTIPATGFTEFLGWLGASD